MYESSELKLSFFSSFVGQETIHTCKECGLTFTCPELFKTHLHQHAVEEEVDVKEEEVQAGGSTGLDPRMSDGDSDEDDASDEKNEAAGGVGGAVSSQKGVASWRAAGSAPANANLRNAYSCLVCGKVYTYLAPFLKHQLEHKLHSGLRRSEGGGSSRRYSCYSCSVCKMTFARKVQLRAHARTHVITHARTRARTHVQDTSARAAALAAAAAAQCDQCGKTFASTRMWAAHMELHKQHFFWCLSCSMGFPDEANLDKHLQGHNRKQHVCTICRKSFAKVSELVTHCQTHTSAKAYQCTLCARSFMFLQNLISHQKRHQRVTTHTSKTRVGHNKGEFSPSRKEQQGTHEAEAPGVGKVESEESDCGELLCQFMPSNQPVKSEFESTALTAGQEDQEEAGGAHLHSELQYQQWDCCVCDMGFDEVEKLRLHYVKHATGELPIPQEYL